MKPPVIAFLISLCLLSASSYAGKTTLTMKSGRTQIFERGLDINALKMLYRKLQLGQVSSIAQEEAEDGLVTKVAFSSSDFSRLNGLLSEWNSAPQVSLPVLTAELAEGGAHYIAVHDINRFFITNSTEETPVLHTDQVCECVVVIGYCPMTQKGFMAHLAYWFKGDLKSDLEAALAKIREGSEKAEHVKTEFYLITRQASNFAQKVLKATKALGLDPQVSSLPGMIQVSRYDEKANARTVYQFVDPMKTELESYIARFARDTGRSIYFDSRDGKVYENLVIEE